MALYKGVKLLNLEYNFIFFILSLKEEYEIFIQLICEMIAFNSLVIV